VLNEGPFAVEVRVSLSVAGEGEKKSKSTNKESESHMKRFLSMYNFSVEDEKRVIIGQMPGLPGGIPLPMT
jgi:hypothetical protein